MRRRRRGGGGGDEEMRRRRRRRRAEVGEGAGEKEKDHGEEKEKK